MNVRENALGVLIVALGTSAPVLAQGEPAAALGAGLSLRAAKQPSPDGTHVPAPLIPSPREWWSLAGAQRSLDFGIGLMPRLGLRHAGHTFSTDAPVDVGPSLRWRSAAGTLIASYGVDPTGISRAESVQLSFSRPIISEQGFRMLAFVGARWQSGRGDRTISEAGERWRQPVEARPLYSSGAATNVGFGLDSYYQVTKSSAIMVGASGLRLGGAPADGALYTNRWQAILYGGYAIRF